MPQDYSKLNIMKEKIWAGKITNRMLVDIVLYVQGKKELFELRKKYGWTLSSQYSFIARGVRLAYQRRIIVI